MHPLVPSSHFPVHEEHGGGEVEQARGEDQGVVREVVRLAELWQQHEWTKLLKRTSLNLETITMSPLTLKWKPSS